MALIQIDHVSKQFRKGSETIVPLQDADLQIERGQFVSLMGASGTGKSTLLNLIAGIDRPTGGRIVVDGTEITQLSRTRLAAWRARNIGYIFQTHNLIPVLTAYENIELPLLLLPMNRGERQRRVAVALTAVDLTDRANHYPRQLSGGQEQRVGIARAIVADPTVVVADEPTGDLDTDTSAQILNLLRRLNEELGTTLLMVTHDPAAAAIAGRPAATGPWATHRGATAARLRTGGSTSMIRFAPYLLKTALASSHAHAAHGERFSRRPVRILLRSDRAAGPRAAHTSGRLGPDRLPGQQVLSGDESFAAGL